MKLNKIWPARIVCILSASFLFLMALACLFPIPKSTNGALAESGSQDPSISISTSGTINLTLKAGGLADSDSASITTATTNYTGYNLYLSSPNGDNKMQLIGGTSDDTIDSITSSTTPESSAFENSWGYKINDAVDYSPIPSDPKGDPIGSSTTASSGDTETLTIAAKAGATKAQGTYVGELTLTAMPNPSKYYSVTYNKNTSETVSNFPSNISETSTTNPTITLASATPARANYVFVGWCATATADGATCPGTLYNPSSVITLDATTANTINIYAVWKSAIYEITLNNQSATTAGTTKLYESYKNNYSLTSGGVATTTITNPARSYTYAVKYDMNGTGITAPTDSKYFSTTRTDTFNGYYTSTTGGTQIINNTGTITAANTYFASNSTIYAQWTNGTAQITLPAITKTGYTCQWALNSASGTKYDGETSAPVAADNTTFVAVCTDTISPNVTSLTSTTAHKSTTQTVTGTCTDDVGVTGYYWGTSAPTTSSTFTTVSSTTSYTNSSLTANSASTYYFACKDAKDNISGVSKTSTTTTNNYKTISFVNYKVAHELQSLSGVSGTYTTANYEASGSVLPSSTTSYLFPTGGTLTLNNLFTTPTGANSTRKGWGTTAPSTSTQSLSTVTTATVTSGATYYGWYDRNTYTISIGVNNSNYGTVDHTSITARYGATITTSGTSGSTTGTISVNGTATNSPTTATATAATGYTTTFSNWTNNCSSPVTGNCTVTANFTRGANTYAIALNNQSATTAGTTTIYEKYNDGYYTDSTTSTNKMSTSANSISLPAKQYAITYDANSQGATYTVEEKHKSSTATFGGYYTGTDGAGTQYIGANGYLTSSASTTNFSAAGTLYAKWTNNGIDKGQLPAISKTGYTCKWAKGSTSGTQYAGETDVTISANTTFYAVCTANTYTVTFKSYNGATTYGTQSYTYDVSQALRSYDATSGWTTKPSAPSGKSFYGWATSANSTTRTYTNAQSVSNLTSTAGGNVTVYAIWSQTLTANFYQTDNTNDSKSVTIYNGATSGSITAPAVDAAPSGKTIVGWGTSATATSSSVASSGTATIGSNTSYYAIYSYTVTASYNGNTNTGGSTASNTGTAYITSKGSSGGTNTTSASVKLATNGFTKTGYTFSKWSTAATGGTQYDAGANVSLSSDQTFYAIWNINSYTASISANVSTYGTVSPTSVAKNYSSSITTSGNTITIGGTTVTATPTAATAQYTYTFDSWTNNCGSSLTKDCTIIANFTRTVNKYTVTIASNNTNYGTVSPTSFTVDYGTSVSTSSNTVTVGTGNTSTATAKSQTGYTNTFSSWTNNCGSSVTGNCTITANFSHTANIYTIALSNQSATTAGTTTIYEKYNTGIYLDSGLTKQMTTSANPITTPAKTYTISYNMNGTGITTPTSPTSSSATFGGYYTSTGGAGDQFISNIGYLNNTASTTKFSANGTLYAKWTNNSITLPTITKTGYTCKWAEGSASGTQYAGGTSRTISANITYYAVCIDTLSPNVTALTSSTTHKATSQTVTGKCTDEVGVTGYYFGTSAPTASSTFTTVTSTTSYTNSSLTANSANTYYFACKDANDNISGVSQSQTTTANNYKSLAFVNYKVGHYLQTLTGTSGTYTDSHYAAYGSVSSNYLFPSGGTLTLNNLFTTPTGANSTRKGWGTTALSSSTQTLKTDTTATVTSGATYYGWYDRNTYTISIGVNNSSYGSVDHTSITARYGATLSTNSNKISVNGTAANSPTTATATAATGYTTTFSSWSTSDCGDTITKNCSVTANFTRGANTYAITLDGNGATTAGTTAIYEKYNTGIYLDSELTKQMTTSANPITTPAKTYTITYNANSQGATYDTTNKTSSSDTFNGYYDGSTQMLNASGYITSNFTTTKYSAAKTLTADWSNNSITLPTITKTGYTCKWASGSASGTKYNSGASVTIPTDGTTFVAVCTANTYTVTINSNNTSYGTVNPTSVSNVPYGSAFTFSNNKITINGTTVTATPASQTAEYTYSFSSWTNNCNSANTMPDKACTITANFARTTRNYTVTWNANGGTVSPTITTKGYGSEIGTLPTPTRADHIFQGWYTSASDGIQISSTTTVTGDVVYYAHWAPLYIWQKNNAIRNNVWDKYNAEEGIVYERVRQSSSSFSYNGLSDGYGYVSDSATLDEFTGQWSGNVRQLTNASSCQSYNGKWFFSNTTSNVKSTFLSRSQPSPSSATYAIQFTGAQISSIVSCNMSVAIYQAEARDGLVKGSTSYGTVYAPANTYPSNGTPDNIYWYTLLNGQYVYEKGSTDYGVVASTSSDAYPDNDYQSGYWYTRVAIDPASTSVLYYDANGGTNAPDIAVSIQDASSTFTLDTSKIPSMNNYAFVGYALSSAATTPDYAYNGSAFSPNTIVVSSSATLYAVWKPSYAITLDNQGATTAGTATIYEIYNTKYSLTANGLGNNGTMTTTNIPISVPRKSYTIKYNANGQNATYNTNGKTSSSATFDGYYSSLGDSSIQYINASGYITPDASSTYFTSNGTLYAKWTNNSITLPTITKNGYTCQWAEGSASGTRYDGGASRLISVNNMNYYAVCFRDLNGISTMQEMTPDIVANTAKGTTKQLRDTRDNKLYWVAKLADDNIWMTQNLDLDLVASDGSVPGIEEKTITEYHNQYITLGVTIHSDGTISAVKSSGNGSFYNPEIEPSTVSFSGSDNIKIYWGNSSSAHRTDNHSMTVTYTVTGGGKTLTPADTDISANWTPSTSTYATGSSTWNWSITSPESYDPGELCWTGDFNWGTLDDTAESCTPEEEENHYQIGNYYNWTAAVAMNDSSSYTDYDYNVDQSICPAGWMLPISGDNTGNGSFAYLLGNYSQDLWTDPLSFVLGGYWYGHSDVVGVAGGYWSSVAVSGDSAFRLYFNSDGLVYPQTNNDRNYGFSVRCVARP